MFTLSALSTVKCTSNTDEVMPKMTHAKRFKLFFTGQITFAPDTFAKANTSSQAKKIL